MSNLRRTKLKDWYEFYRETCPICQKRGGCMINSKGDTVVCIRQESDIQFSKKFPSWIHRLKEKRSQKPSDDVTNGEFIESNPKESPHNLHKVYKGLIEVTRLTDAHYDRLVNREMTDEEIYYREYRSFPEQPWKISTEITNMTETSLRGIPGFYENNYGWTLSGFEGILIPYRNEWNQIIGFQTRIDKPKNDVEVTPGAIKGLQAVVKKQPNLVQVLIDGEIIEELTLELGKTHTVYANSGLGFVKLVKGQRYFWMSSANKPNGTGAGDPMPVHVAVPTHDLRLWDSGNLRKASSVWITEGGLKADIAVEHIVHVYDKEELAEIGTTFLAIAGVNSWRAVLPILKNMDVKQVNIAFDMDAMQNPNVAFYLKQMAIELKKGGYSANLALWNINDGKGIDDILAYRKKYPTLKKLF